MLLTPVQALKRAAFLLDQGMSALLRACMWSLYRMTHTGVGCTGQRFHTFAVCRMF